MSDGGRLYSELFGDAAVSAQLSDSATIQAMLDVEVALAAVQADRGIIPARSADAIAAAARAQDVDRPTVARQAASAGNVAIPLIADLRKRVALIDRSAATWVHFGATSQDIIDTALVLQLRAAVPRVRARLDAAATTARTLASAHVHTVMVGRTWLRHATPITFGLTAAGWADALRRVFVRLGSALDDVSVLQLGGATGSLAGLGDQAIAIGDAVAARLGLANPTMPWHTHRDRVASLACALGVVCGVLGKIARDVALLSQTEIGELGLAGGGGSSAMPHKRNPVECALAIAAAIRAPGLVATVLSAMAQEHERGLGGWPAEWQTLTELVSITAGSARAVETMLATIEVHPERMRTNLQMSQGVIMSEAVTLALATIIGREQAHEHVARAAAEVDNTGKSFLDALSADPAIVEALDRATLERLLDPAQYLGAAPELIARVQRAAETAGD
jgi:3-carboxy-cis,cis-muconate cycloisomerase